MLQKIKNLFNKEIMDFDNDGKIESLREETVGLLSSFKRIYIKLGDVNIELERVVNDEQQKKQQAENNISKASVQIEQNKKLQEKVNDFIIEE